MTSDSRVEAVARAIAVRYQHNPDKAWEDYIEDAQAAIEANDAWLESRPIWHCPNCTIEAHYPYPKECRGCGDFCPYSERFNQ